METFIRRTVDDPAALSPELLTALATETLDRDVPWPTARALWLARLNRIAPWFVAREVGRQQVATPTAFEEEAKGRLVWSDTGFTLVGRADRIDRTAQGSVHLYDYKTGRVPKEKEQKAFDKQLLIEAAMIAEGAFETIGPAEVERAVFIGLGSNPEEADAPLDAEPPDKVLAELRLLIDAYNDPAQGFAARRMMQKESFGSDFDLLARHGEWDITDDPTPEDLT
jgi:RecB family exonuclease